MDLPPKQPLRWIEQVPVPGRFWIRHAPRAWPAPEEPCVDLAREGLWEGTPEVALEWDRPLADVVYLPPVAESHREERFHLAVSLAERGTPVLVQELLLPGAAGLRNADGAGASVAAVPGVTVLYDLLPALAPPGGGEADLLALGSLPPGAAVVWPLIPGLSDDPELWRRGAERLAAAGASVVQALAPTLSPSTRRRLAEGRSQKVFNALFHRSPPAERTFARVAWAAVDGAVRPFLPRPLPRPPLTGAGNRRLAGELALAAELWLALERPPGRGLALTRAARWVDATSYDVEALCREGNLGVVTQIDEEVRRLMEASCGQGPLPLLEELITEYAGPLKPALAEPEVAEAEALEPEVPAPTEGEG